MTATRAIVSSDCSAPANAVERHRAAASVEQRDAHQQGRGAGAPQDQVLERRLGGLRAPVGEQDERVYRQRHQLEAQEQREEAVRGQEQADAVQRGQQQDRERALTEIVARDDEHEQREHQDDGLAGRRGRIHREMPGKRRIVVAAQRKPHRRRRGERHGRERNDVRGARRAARDLEAEEHDDAGEQQVLRQHGGDDRRPVHRALSSASRRSRGRRREGRDGQRRGTRRDARRSARC